MPNYDDREEDTYLYVTAVSDEDRQKGAAVGDVLMYRYLGKQDGKFVLVSVDDSGAAGLRYECSDPCRIIKVVDGRVLHRIPFDTASVIGAAFQDAIKGRLEVAAEGADKAARANAKAEPPIPAAFVGEWDEDPSFCGSGLSDTSLSVTPAKLQFYESDGEVRRVEVHNSRSVTVHGSFSGEGQTWDDSLTMVLSGSGNDLTIDGFTRHRC